MLFQVCTIDGLISKGCRLREFSQDLLLLTVKGGFLSLSPLFPSSVC